MASVTVMVVAMALATFCLLISNTSAAYQGCCLKYTKSKIPFTAIKGYSVQTLLENCPINAIIFHTKKGRVCADPAHSWVMDYIDRLRTKAQLVHIKTSQHTK